MHILTVSNFNSELYCFFYEELEMRKILTLCMAIVLYFGITTTVNATMIDYDVKNLVGNTWEYTYTVQNDTLSIGIEEFSIYFDVGLYENLTPTSTPSDWDPVAFDPDPFLPDDGLTPLHYQFLVLPQETHYPGSQLLLTGWGAQVVPVHSFLR